ncbi:MAG: DUF6794 domain-containing protein [Bacteroidota bacterium]
MKLLFTISLTVFFNLAFGQIKDPWKGKPKSIEESFEYFDQMFDDTAKYTFQTLPEDIAASRLHHGFGRWIRNNWGLWGSGDLKTELVDSGFVHPDDMSSVLLKAYHRRLNKKPLDLKKDALFYQAYRKRTEGDGFSTGDLSSDFTQDTTMEELLSYFPVGDTIIVSVYASTKKLFQTYASSVKGMAVVKSHEADNLNVQLLSIKHKKKHEPERQIGDEYAISPFSCSLIPPKGWAAD